MEDTVVKIIERYQNRYWYGGSPIMYGTVEASMAAMATDGVASNKDIAISERAGSVPTRFSETNTQVAGVDEADIVKTDGKNIYTYAQGSSQVRIVRANDLALQKIITLPEGFSSIEMYLANDRLVLIGQKYQMNGSYYTARWFPPENKTIVAIYNILNPKTPVLERYNQIDGSYRESRLIGSTLYFLSASDLRIPPVYTDLYAKDATNGWSRAVTDMKKDFALKNVVPQVREVRVSTNSGKYLQNIRTTINDCAQVSFVLPDDETLKNIDFTPSFVSLSSIDIREPTMKMKSDLLFGDVSQIHMSKNSLYITSVISQNTTTASTSCPPNARCMSPIYQYKSSTLIHRYQLVNGGLSYVYSKSVDGNPMTQYSMDEDENGNFRIVTQNYAWSSGENKNSTILSVLDPK